MTSGSTAPEQGVLGPQCSQDSSSSANQLHIVYGHAIPGAQKVECNSGNGPSDGICWWYGEWELVFGDVYINSSGDPDIDPACGGTCAEPGLVQSTIRHVNPRDNACNPTCYATGSGTVTHSVVAGTTIYTLTLGSVMGTISSMVAGAGIALTPAAGGSTGYRAITCYDTNPGDYSGTCGTNTLTLAAPGVPDGTYNFVIKNYVVYEPHWYVSNLGDLYLTANRKPVYHDEVGIRYNVTSQTLQELAADEPPPGTAPTAFRNTYFNEFLTPDPTGAHMIFMSDRATDPSHFSFDPEYSDHYMCTGPNCQNIVRLTYYNDTGIDSTVPFTSCTPNSSFCFPITAVRGAWSPDGKNYMTLVEYLAYTMDTGMVPGAVMYNYSLSYPSTEISGGVVLSGGVTVH